MKDLFSENFLSNLRDKWIVFWGYIYIFFIVNKYY